MAPRFHTLLFTGWIILLVGLGGIFIPVLIAHALGLSDHPVLFPILVSAMCVTAMGGLMTLGVILQRHRPKPPALTPIDNGNPDQADRCDAIFQWQHQLDPGDEAGIHAISNIQNAAVRALAVKLYQKPSIKFRLNNISRSQADNYHQQLSDCGISCTFEPASPAHEADPTPIERLLAILPENPVLTTTQAALLSLLAILWPLLIPAWHQSDPIANPPSTPPVRLFSPTLPLSTSAAKTGTTHKIPVEQQRLIANLALIDFPFKSMAGKRDLTIAALHKNDFQGAEQLLLHTVNEIREENAINPIRDDQLATNAANLLGALGELQMMQSKPAQAADHFSQAVRMAPQAEQKTQLLQQQGDALYQAGNTVEAEEALLESVKTAKNEISPKHPLVVSTLSSLALFYESQGLHQKAEPILRETLALQEEIHGFNHIRTAETLDLLATVMSNQNQLREALVLEEQSLRIKETTLGATHPSLIGNLANITELLVQEGRLEEADQTQKRLVEIKKLAPPSPHPDTGQPTIPEKSPQSDQTSPMQQPAPEGSNQQDPGPTTSAQPSPPSTPAPSPLSTAPSDATPSLPPTAPPPGNRA
ncbi:MAG: tetratricopeptide repeat protein [Magnetococcales bacterium]|nr:tetratricopeptide repeat protein [Magnetococcales bacterium]